MKNNKIQFSWEGKEEALQECNTPPKIKYEIPEMVDGNEIHCIDNLDFLKNNQERLQGKVKCIYIDPPYNTGKDFIYKDKRHMKNECKHSKWLSFMYPRLVLAREMLREDGVIFISIDDNEQANLRLLMNEVFGEGEFVGQFIWHKKTQPSFLSKEISIVTEYILSYRKNESLILNGGETDPDKLIELLNISNIKSQRILSKNNVIIQNGNFSGRIDGSIFINGEDLMEALIESKLGYRYYGGKKQVRNWCD